MKKGKEKTGLYKDWLIARHDEETALIMKELARKGVNKSEFIRNAVKRYYRNRDFLRLEEELGRLERIVNGLSALASVKQEAVNTMSENVDSVSDDVILAAGLKEFLEAGFVDEDDIEI